MSKKHDLESNKIFASILLAALIAMLAGFITNLLYPENNSTSQHAEEVRGYQVEIANNSDQPKKAIVAEVIDIAALMKNASIEKGSKVAKKCSACHSFNKGGPNKVGPNIYNVLDSQIASKPGYAYSDALSSKDKTWTYEEIFAFLKSPKKYAKGTKMSFAGLRKPQDIANLVAFLRSQSNQ